MASNEDKDLWIEFAHAAMGAYSQPEDIKEEDVVDDMVDVSTEYADAMLDAIAERFGGETGGKKRRTRKTRKDEDEE